MNSMEGLKKIEMEINDAKQRKVFNGENLVKDLERAC